MAPSTRRWIGWALLALLALVALGVAVVIDLANAPLPQAPELQGIRVAPPVRPGPVSPSLVVRKGAPGTAHPGTGEVAMGAPWPASLDRVLSLTRRRWPDDPQALAAKAGKLAPSSPRAREALLAPGCMPPVKVGPAFTDSMVLHLTTMGRRLALDAVLAAGRGDTEEAAATLVAINERYVELERCVPQLTEAMFLAAAIDKTHAQFRWVLAADPSEATVATFAKHSAMLETRASPLPDAYRLEYLNIRVGWVGDIGPWPWYDQEESEALWRLSARRAVSLAEAGPRDAALARELPEDAWVAALQATPSWYGLFRFNHLGRIAMPSQGAGRYVTYWYTQRCWLAARRALWSRELASRGAVLPKLAEPREPWSDAPFGDAASAGRQCDPPPALGGLQEARVIAPLPEGVAQ